MLDIQTATYLINGGISLTLGVLLLTLKSFQGTESKADRTIKQYLAYTAFIDVLIDAVMLYVIFRGTGNGFPDSFALPAAYWCQVFFLASVTLIFFREHDAYGRFLRWGTYPLGVLMLLFLGGFAAFLAGHGGIPDPLTHYCRTDWYAALTIAAHILVLLAILGSFVLIAMAARRFSLNVVNFFSGEDAVKFSKVKQFFTIYSAYIIVTTLNMFLFGEALSIVCISLRAVLKLLTVLFVFNTEPLLMNTGQKMADYDAAEEEAGEEGEKEVLLRAKIVESAMERWLNSKDKPYLKEGLTLSDAADQMGISGLQLSYYLNHHLGVNFNSWINRLRIGKAKRLMEANPQMQISDVASAVGYSEIAVFSRNFKKAEGITATEYKKRCAPEVEIQ